MDSRGNVYRLTNEDKEEIEAKLKEKLVPLSEAEATALVNEPVEARRRFYRRRAKGDRRPFEQIISEATRRQRKEESNG